MHEQSNTTQLPSGKWHNEIGTNRYGELGKHLEPMFPFERNYYDTSGEADQAAAKRSDSFSRELDFHMDRHGAFARLRKGLDNGSPSTY